MLDVKKKYTAKLMLLIFFIFSIYSVLAFKILPEKFFFSGDSGVMLIEAQSIIINKWKSLSIPYHGRYIDEAQEFFPIIDTHKSNLAFIEANIDRFIVKKDDKFYYLHHLPFILLAGVAFSLMGYKGLYVISILFSICALIVMYHLARFITQDKGISLSSVITLGLASPLFFYSVTFWGHTYGVFFSLLSILQFLCSMRNGKKRFLILSGVFMGIGTYIRPELYIFSSGLLLSFLITERKVKAFYNVILFLLGLCFALLPLWVFQYNIYGNLFGSAVGEHYDLLFNNVKKNIFIHLLTIAKNIFFLLIGSPFSLEQRQSWVSLIGILAAVPFFNFLFINMRYDLSEKEKWLHANLFIILLVSVIICIQSYYNVMTSLFLSAPFIVMAFLNFQDRERPIEIQFLLSFSVIYPLLICLVSFSSGGPSWAPRYLLPILPLFNVLSLNVLKITKKLSFSFFSKKMISNSLVAILILSLFIQLGGVKRLYEVKMVYKQIADSLCDLNARYIVSDIWWIPQELGSLYFERNLFYVKNQITFMSLLNLFKKKDINKFSYITFHDLIKINDYKVINKIDKNGLKIFSFEHKNIN